MSAAGLTAVDPFTTRDTVERETPAAAATSSMVTTARSDPITGNYLVIAGTSIARVAMMRRYSSALSFNERSWVS